MKCVIQRRILFEHVHAKSNTNMFPLSNWMPFENKQSSNQVLHCALSKWDPIQKCPIGPRTIHLLCPNGITLKRLLSDTTLECACIRMFEELLPSPTLPFASFKWVSRLGRLLSITTLTSAFSRSDPRLLKKTHGGFGFVCNPGRLLFKDGP